MLRVRSIDGDVGVYLVGDHTSVAHTLLTI